MFLLDIISGNLNNGSIDDSGKLFDTENKISSLEALLKSIYVNDSDLNKEGLQISSDLSNMQIDMIKQQIASVREKENTLLSAFGDFVDPALLMRYNEIKNELLSAEQGVKEFEASMQRKDEFLKQISSIDYSSDGGENNIKIATQLLDMIPTVKNDTWFKSCLDGLGESLSKIDEEKQALQKQLSELNQEFVSIIAGDSNKSNEETKSKILEVINQMNFLNTEKELFTQIENIASADSGNETKLLEEAKKNLISEYEKSLKTEQMMSAMYKRMELQGLLTALTLGKQSAFSVDGVDNSDIDAVTKALDAAKADELRLEQESGIKPESIALVNQNFTKKMDEMVTSRIGELHGVESYLTKANQVFYDMIQNSGMAAPVSFYLQDPNMVANKLELQQLEEYKKGIDEMRTYWDGLPGDNNIPQNPPVVEPKPITKPTPKAIQAIAAGAEKNVNNLKEIFNLISGRESVESLKSRESSIKQELESEISKLNSLISTNPHFLFEKQNTSDKIAELRTTLSGVMQERSRSVLLERIESSLKEAISKGSIYYGIYSK